MTDDSDHFGHYIIMILNFHTVTLWLMIQLVTWEKMRTLCPSSLSFFSIFWSSVSFPEDFTSRLPSYEPLGNTGASCKGKSGISGRNVWIMTGTMSPTGRRAWTQVGNRCRRPHTQSVSLTGTRCLTWRASSPQQPRGTGRGGCSTSSGPSWCWAGTPGCLHLWSSTPRSSASGWTCNISCRSEVKNQTV